MRGLALANKAIMQAPDRIQNFPVALFLKQEEKKNQVKLILTAYLFDQNMYPTCNPCEPL